MEERRSLLLIFAQAGRRIVKGDLPPATTLIIVVSIKITYMII